MKQGRNNRTWSNSSKHVLLGIAILLLVIFVLDSCRKRIVDPFDIGTEDITRIKTTASGEDSSDSEGSSGGSTSSKDKDAATLNQPLMSFTLFHAGREIPINTLLVYGNTYQVVVTPENGAAVKTADYLFNQQPINAFTISSRNTNLIVFMVNGGGSESATIIATHKDDSSITGSLRLNLIDPDIPRTGFARDIEGTTVPDLDTVSDGLTRDVLGPLGAAAGAALEKRYVTEIGAGDQDGSSWANAWAATNLRENVNNINDASANRVYLIMVAGGSYTPDYSSPANRDISFSMKNYMTIMGGFQREGGWIRNGTTTFSGDIGNVGDALDNSYHVFHHNSLALANAHLYGVVISGGNANGTGFQENGGGMLNRLSSPVLTRVVFTENNADKGGGMYNLSSAPSISSAVFSGNSANMGAAVFNNVSTPAPVFRNTVFTRNRAVRDGGGIYNRFSGSVVINAVFTGNTATTGGAMWNDNDDGLGPIILNSIFVGNNASAGGNAIAILAENSGAENLHIAGSVLGVGLENPSDAVVGVGTGGSISVTYHQLKNSDVNLGTDVSGGNGLLYPTIRTSSSAVDLGLYVKRSGTTYYFSEDNTAWYSGFSATGGWGSTANPPADAEDLTTTDIVGSTRSGNPDAGVYELQ